MRSPFLSGVGCVISADIAVPDHERVVGFYARVLTTGHNPLWRDDLMSAQGIPVIGLGARGPEYAHLPLQWMPHIQVADVAASAQRALALGGTELMHGKDDNGRSQWAVLLDPTGAAFGLIPVVPAGSLPASQPTTSGDASWGCIQWLDLTVCEAEATRDFYARVVGWSAQAVDMEDADGHYSDYSMCGTSGTPAAGICHDRGANLGIPPVWMLYLPVGDLSESLGHVFDGGGKVLKTTTGTEGAHASAIIQDPVGVCLGLVSG